MRIILHFLRISVNNARIIYNSGLHENNKLPALDFIQQVVIGWCNDEYDVNIENQDTNIVMCKKFWARKRWEREFLLRSKGLHFPEEVIRTERDCRGDCKYCTKKCYTKCQQCGIFLHIKKGDNEDCFVKFHTQREFDDFAEFLEPN